MLVWHGSKSLGNENFRSDWRRDFETVMQCLCWRLSYSSKSCLNLWRVRAVHAEYVSDLGQKKRRIIASLRITSSWSGFHTTLCRKPFMFIKPILPSISGRPPDCYWYFGVKAGRIIDQPLSSNRDG